jgi:AcrR family transcriptional regulator
MRADAARNRKRILDGARICFIEHDAMVPLEMIAARAGVGIGTLYRRFPDRQALMRAVAHDVLTVVVSELRSALAEEPGAFAALARYMTRALELRIAAVMPLLAVCISLDDDDLMALRQQATGLIETIIADAKAEGTLRSEIAFGDISLLLIRLGRPIPGSFPREVQDALALRHLHLLIDGLWAGPGRFGDGLPGPAMTIEALRARSSSAANTAGGSEVEHGPA